MAYISKYVDLDGSQYDIKSKKTAAIPFAQVDSTSTSTNFTATVPEITELYDGVCVYLRNGVVTSASGFTLNINGLGALPVYGTLAAATRSTTLFNINYTMLFIYNSSRVDGGCWDCFYGYDSNTNTIGYQVRTNSSSRPMENVTYRYRLLFTSADNTKWVPANNSSSTNATAARTVNQTKINPFGEIVYYGTTASVAANSQPSASSLWQQYTLVLGYSFNISGGDLTLTYPAPVYLKCAPQNDGSAIIDSATPYVQSLPSSEDGKIYIYLGRAYDATHIELLIEHPVYYYKDGQIRPYTNPAARSITVDSALSATSENPVQNKVITNELSTKQDTLTFDLTPVYGSNNVVESGGIYNAIDVAAKEAGILIDAGYITDYGISGGDLIFGENVLFDGQNCSLYNEINAEYSIGYTNISIRLKEDGPEAATSSMLPSSIDHSDSDTIYREAYDYLMHFEYADTYGFYFSTLLNGYNSASNSDTGNLYAVLFVSSTKIILTYKALALGIVDISFALNIELNKYELTSGLSDAITKLFTYGPTRVNLVDVSNNRQPRYYRITNANFSAGFFIAENINEYNMLSLFALQVTNPDFTQNQYFISLTSKTLAGVSDIPTATSQLANDSGFITDAGVTSFNGSTGAITYTAPVTSVNGSTGAVTGLQTTGNLVASVSSSSTDAQYPSAKLFYDTVGDLETLLAAI